MPMFRVEGTGHVSCYMEVEADTPEEAIEKAYEDTMDLTNFSGNGDIDKLVGVDSCSLVSLDAGEIDWKTAEPL